MMSYKEANTLLRPLIIGIFIVCITGIAGVNAATIISFKGSVGWAKSGSSRWLPVKKGQQVGSGDRLRTLQNSFAIIRLTDRSVQRMGPTSNATIHDQPKTEGGVSSIFLRLGRIFFKGSDQPDTIRVNSPLMSGAIRGTEFVFEVNADGKTTLSLMDGDVLLESESGPVQLTSGQTAIAERNLLLHKLPKVEAAAVIQWCLYYPAVLDPEELGLAGNDRMQESLRAYREGNLLRALETLPEDRKTTEERIYRAAVLLSTGDVALARTELLKLGSNADQTHSRAIAALRTIIAVVNGQPHTAPTKPELASEWLALTYHHQSLGDLDVALACANEAVAASPNFGLAHAKVAELQFAFGDTAGAIASVERSLQLSPKNAQALSVRGFLSAAEGNWITALEYFDRSIEADDAFANAWLGRGLVKIRQGKSQAGRADLEVAAALEPNRSLLRSYLAKGHQRVGDYDRARKSLRLAHTLDEHDPTAWLYAALINWEQNRINTGVRDLEQSSRLNDNRKIFRSRMMLDQDQAVRSANLAGIYRDAGMAEVSVREAAKAVQRDYANYSSHFFLANSYNPRLLTQRLETPAISEYLLANLLAPVAAGGLNRSISEQEYSRLFERDGATIASSTLYSTEGNWQQNGTIYGNTESIGYVVDTIYRTQRGTRPNHDLYQLGLTAQLKMRLTQHDHLYLEIVGNEFQSGDLSQSYNHLAVSPALRVSERQDPIIVAGYRHEWSPGNHSLFLAGRLVDKLRITDPAQPVTFLGRGAGGAVVLAATPTTPTAAFSQETDMEIYTFEAQQLFQRPNHSLIAGARLQLGGLDTVNTLGPSTAVTLGTTAGTVPGLFTTPAIAQSTDNVFERASVYSYFNRKLVDELWLTLGASYDRIRAPDNFRSAPVVARSSVHYRFSPKLGLIWTPLKSTTIRAAYARSLGGVSFEHSTRLEPSQLAGFNQTYRELISPSMVGPQQTADFDVYSVGLDWQSGRGTYLGTTAELLYSGVPRTVGTFDLDTTTFGFPVSASSTSQNMDYFERNLTVYVNQLIGDLWTLGARYQLSDSDLHSHFSEIPTAVSAAANTDLNSTLHQTTIFARFHHPSGWYSRAEANWIAQSNRNYPTALPGDDFWQFNAFVGYRFHRRAAEIELGLWNVTDRDYRLSPLNLHAEFARNRLATVSFRFRF